MKVEGGQRDTRIEDNIEYWKRDHSDDYKQTRKRFIGVVNKYNQNIAHFTPEQKTAFSNIYNAWRSRMYDQSPWMLFSVTMEDHKFLDDTINDVDWNGYYVEMFNYHKQDDIRKYRIHYDTVVKTGEPEYHGPRGPTGQV
jgi:hypothetical protein